MFQNWKLVVCWIRTSNLMAIIVLDMNTGTAQYNATQISILKRLIPGSHSKIVLVVLIKVWHHEQLTLPQLVCNDMPAVNEVAAESCAVVCSILLYYFGWKDGSLMEHDDKTRWKRPWLVREWILRRGISWATNLANMELKKKKTDADDLKNLPEDHFESVAAHDLRGWRLSLIHI